MATIIAAHISNLRANSVAVQGRTWTIACIAAVIEWSVMPVDLFAIRCASTTT